MDLALLQRQVAPQLAVHVSTLTSWELNRRAPALWNMPGVIGFLGRVPFEVGQSLPERLRVYRKIHGLSQEKFAGILGLDESTLWKWESGKSKPKREHELRVEAFLARERRIFKTAVETL